MLGRSWALGLGFVFGRRSLNGKFEVSFGEGYTRFAQCNVDFGHQLSIWSGTETNHGKPWSSWPVRMIEWPRALKAYQSASVTLPSGRVCVEIWATSSGCIGHSLAARSTQLYIRLLHVSAYWRRQCVVFVRTALVLRANVYGKHTALKASTKPHNSCRCVLRHIELFHLHLRS